MLSATGLSKCTRRQDRIRNATTPTSKRGRTSSRWRAKPSSYARPSATRRPRPAPSPRLLKRRVTITSRSWRLWRRASLRESSRLLTHKRIAFALKLNTSIFRRLQRSKSAGLKSWEPLVSIHQNLEDRNRNAHDLLRKRSRERDLVMSRANSRKVSRRVSRKISLVNNLVSSPVEAHVMDRAMGQEGRHDQHHERNRLAVRLSYLPS